MRFLDKVVRNNDSRRADARYATRRLRWFNRQWRLGVQSRSQGVRMDERELRLNSIRFDKQSPRLTLEEHSHCEVPAGCGGVVLRWRQRTTIPLEIWLHVVGEFQAFLDGKSLISGRPLLEQGITS